jgi:hypothetical protein
MRVTDTDVSPKFPWTHLAAALLLLALLRLPSLDMPLDRDEGEYATLAWSWFHGLGVPYRDFLEQKPPLAILAYAAAFFAGGMNPPALRFFALFWQMVSSAAVFALVLRVSGKPFAALLAGALYACLSASAMTQGLSANTELFVTLPLCAAVTILTYGRSTAHLVLAGFLMGIASLAKQSALPAACLIPLAIEGSALQRLRAALACAGAAALAWLLCSLAFGAMGAAGDFWNCVVFYNIGYASQGLQAQLGNLGAACLSLAREDWALWICLGLALAKFWRGLSGPRASLGLLWAWLASMLLGTALSGRYYPHYFQPLAAPMACLAALWAFSGGRAWPKALALGLFAAVFALVNLPLWAAEDGLARSVRQFGMPGFAQAPATAEAIRSHTPEGSRILVWGSDAELYFLSQRPPATRFLFNYPFTGEAPAWPGGGDEILKAMEDRNTSAMVLRVPLDRGDPLQRQMGILLQKHYALRVDLAPDTLIGLRKD